MSEEFSLKEVNRARDPKSLTAMEKKHLPVILEAPDAVEKGQPFKVRVKVGGIGWGGTSQPPRPLDKLDRALRWRDTHS